MERVLVEHLGERLRTARLHRDARVIAGCTLITATSANGGNGRRRYSAKALRQIATMAEGLPAYANHVSPDRAFRPRDIRDLIGRHVNVRLDRDRVVSDLQLVEHAAPWVFSLAERLGDHVGNSLVSRGVVRMEGDGTEVVDEIVAVRSVDLVSDPASTRGLFEAQVNVIDIRHLAEACADYAADRQLGTDCFRVDRADLHEQLAAALIGRPIVTLPEGFHERLARALGVWS